MDSLLTNDGYGLPDFDCLESIIRRWKEQRIEELKHETDFLIAGMYGGDGMGGICIVYQAA